MPGPPPKHPDQRRRTNATVAMTQLPKDGRQGDPPVWPLPGDVVAANDLAKLRDNEASILGRLDELEPGSKEFVSLSRKLAATARLIEVLEVQIAVIVDLEAELWRELWATPQAVAWERERWTRTVAQYVRWKAKAELGDLDAGKEARMYEDRLGLNALALLRLRWEISPQDEVAEKRQTVSKARARLKAVDPGAMASG